MVSHSPFHLSLLALFQWHFRISVGNKVAIIPTRGLLIIDYWGTSKNLRDAFELYDDTDIQNSLKPLDDQKELLKEQHKKVMDYFANLDLSAEVVRIHHNPNASFRSIS
jgi:type I site-specific restriction-modification system R (restriction) subunit